MAEKESEKDDGINLADREAIADLLLNGEEAIVISPSTDTLELIANIADSSNEPAEDVFSNVRVLINSTVERDIQGNFPLATRLQGLLGTMSIRTADETEIATTPLIATDSVVVSFIRVGDGALALRDDDAEKAASVLESLEHAWDALDADESDGPAPQISGTAGPEASFRTPSRETIESSLEEMFEETEFDGEAIAADFLAVLEAAEADDRLENPEVRGELISLFVAAKHGVSLYDISKWGEDVNIASKATFSRAKTRIEDQGIIDTEKIPIDVGRPRLRLIFPEGTDTSTESLVDMIDDAAV